MIFVQEQYVLSLSLTNLSCPPYPCYSFSFLALIIFTIVNVNDLCHNEVHEREKGRKKRRMDQNKKGWIEYDVT